VCETSTLKPFFLIIIIIIEEYDSNGLV